MLHVMRFQFLVVTLRSRQEPKKRGALRALLAHPTGWNV